ncbi:hypothetical protein ACFY8C_08235 [Streptomyces flavochromogenes]|uniref:Uncharacterized protein n=1 Tax=Streptomyces flavochromogenes TaxID=68199 RepID=A0ABW6XLL1_9ACTN|nr:hypothetical protein [Streptomyces flavochromogenes]
MSPRTPPPPTARRRKKDGRRSTGGRTEAISGDCARAARVGGFTEAEMSKWDLPAKTVLCVLTDKGNIARVVITGFIGGNPQSTVAPPTQITLEVTLWKPGT